MNARSLETLRLSVVGFELTTKSTKKDFSRSSFVVSLVELDRFEVRNPNEHRPHVVTTKQLTRSSSLRLGRPSRLLRNKSLEQAAS